MTSTEVHQMILATLGKLVAKFGVQEHYGLFEAYLATGEVSPELRTAMRAVPACRSVMNVIAEAELRTAQRIAIEEGVLPVGPQAAGASVATPGVEHPIGAHAPVAEPRYAAAVG